MQNTAKTIELTRRGEIDTYPSKFKILGSKYNENDFNKNLTEKYQKDPEAYYPYVDLNKEIIPKFEAPKLNKDATYPLDKKPYYSPTGIYREIPVIVQGKVVKVNDGDLQSTFPSGENIQYLQTKLKAIALRENLDFQRISEKGVYYADPKAYYDPSTEDTVLEINTILKQIQDMKKSLEESAKNTVEAKVDLVKVKKQIQNQNNYEAEARFNKIDTNYYTPVQNQNGYNVEFPVGTIPSNQPAIARTPLPPGPKVDVDIVQHDYVDADIADPSTNNNGGTTSGSGTKTRKTLKNTSNTQLENTSIKKKSDKNLKTNNQ